MVLSIIMMMCSCKWMAAGSYPFVESYNVPLKEDLVIASITKFKDDHPQFAIPDNVYNGTTRLDLKDGRDENNPNDRWYNLEYKSVMI